MFLNESQVNQVQVPAAMQAMQTMQFQGQNSKLQRRGTTGSINVHAFHSCLSTDNQHFNNLSPISTDQGQGLQLGNGSGKREMILTKDIMKMQLENMRKNIFKGALPTRNTEHMNSRKDFEYEVKLKTAQHSENGDEINANRSFNSFKTKMSNNTFQPVFNQLDGLQLRENERSFNMSSGESPGNKTALRRLSNSKATLGTNFELFLKTAEIDSEASLPIVVVGTNIDALKNLASFNPKKFVVVAVFDFDDEKVGDRVEIAGSYFSIKPLRFLLKCARKYKVSTGVIAFDETDFDIQSLIEEATQLLHSAGIKTIVNLMNIAYTDRSYRPQTPTSCDGKANSSRVRSESSTSFSSQNSFLKDFLSQSNEELGFFELYVEKDSQKKSFSPIRAVQLLQAWLPVGLQLHQEGKNTISWISLVGNAVNIELTKKQSFYMYLEKVKVNNWSQINHTKLISSARDPKIGKNISNENLPTLAEHSTYDSKEEKTFTRWHSLPTDFVESNASVNSAKTNNYSTSMFEISNQHDNLFSDVLDRKLVLAAEFLFSCLDDAVSQHDFAWKSMLIYGLPGSGKSLIIKSFIKHQLRVNEAKKTQPKYVYIPCIEICQKNFSLTKIVNKHDDNKAVTVLVLDNFERIASNKQFQSDILFLMKSLQQRNIVLLAVTNVPWEIDLSIFSLFEKKLMTRLPNSEERVDYMRYLISEFSGEDKTANRISDVKLLSRMTKFFTCWDLKLAFKDIFMSYTKLSKNDEEEGDLLILAKEKLKDHKPTATVEILKLYQKFSDKFGGSGCTLAEEPFETHLSLYS